MDMRMHFADGAAEMEFWTAGPSGTAATRIYWT
jgi:hypothetical protein